MTASPFFEFEADFVESLRCIPMQVRQKLDTCGIKLKLEQWHAFEAQERQRLVALPCDSEAEVRQYRDELVGMICDRTSTPPKELAVDPAPAWKNPDAVAPEVAAKAETLGVAVPLESWQQLSDAQRFALCKLGRSNHEGRNFLPALKEFGVISAETL